MPNQLNHARIDRLHPLVIPKARKWLLNVEAEGINVLVTQTLRTVEEQNKLYAQGRTSLGQVVTQVRGGYSYHNYGLALDFVLLNEMGDMCWNVDSDWHKVAEIGKACGFAWGGDWEGFKDYPHLEMNFGLSCAELKAGKQPKEVCEMDEAHARFIETILKEYYASMEAYPAIQAYTHECAVEVRRLAGIPEEVNQ
jgi:hypothetical protein